MKNQEIKNFIDQLAKSGLIKNPLDLRVLECIARNQRLRGHAFLRKQTLADFMRVSIRTLERSTKRLRDLGLLEYRRGKTKNYRVIFKPIKTPQNLDRCVSQNDANLSQNDASRVAISPMCTYKDYTNYTLHLGGYPPQVPRNGEAESVSFSVSKREGVKTLDQPNSSLEQIKLSSHITLDKAALLLLNASYGPSNVLDAVRVLTEGAKVGKTPYNENWLPQIEAFLKKRAERNKEKNIDRKVIGTQNSSPQLDRNPMYYHEEYHKHDSDNRAFANRLMRQPKEFELSKQHLFCVNSSSVSVGREGEQTQIFYTDARFKEILTAKLRELIAKGSQEKKAVPIQRIEERKALPKEIFESPEKLKEMERKRREEAIAHLEQRRRIFRGECVTT